LRTCWEARPKRASSVGCLGMRILVARCEIAYHGRATTRLGAGDRVILFKDDGSLCVHAQRGYKPLNDNLTRARGS
jgi:RecB family endonuclease NucS